MTITNALRFAQPANPPLITNKPIADLPQPRLKLVCSAGAWGEADFQFETFEEVWDGNAEVFTLNFHNDDPQEISHDTFEHYVARAREKILNSGIPTGDIVLVDHSLGCRVGMCLASQIKFAGLVLLHPGPSHVLDLPVLSAIALLTYAGKLWNKEAFVPSVKDADKILFDGIDETIKRSMYAGLRPESSLILRQMMGRGLPTVKPLCRTLIVSGSAKKDHLSTPELGRRLANHFGKIADFVQVNTGHYSFIENPKLIAELIRNWIIKADIR
jgi:pimeloyl-ACP methyl ester carboxylesterase